MDRAGGRDAGVLSRLFGCFLGSDADGLAWRSARIDPTQGEARRRRSCCALMLLQPSAARRVNGAATLGSPVLAAIAKALRARQQTFDLPGLRGEAQLPRRSA